MTRIRLYWRLLLVYGLIRTITATITTIDNFHLPLIGSPLSNSSSLHRFLHTYTPGVDIAKRTLLYTVTENNILAALDPHTGALGKLTNDFIQTVWRYQARGIGLLQYVACSSTRLILYSPGQGLRSMEALTGETKWRRELYFESDAVVSMVCSTTEPGTIVIAIGEMLELVDKDGRSIWKRDASSFDSRIVGMAVEKNGQIAVGSLKANSELTVRLFDTSKDEHPTGIVSFYVGEGFSECRIVSDSNQRFTVVWLSKGNVYSFDGTSTIPLKLPGKTDFFRLSDLLLPLQTTFLAERADGTATVLRIEDGVVTRLWEFLDPSDNVHFSSHVDRLGATYIGRLTYSQYLRLGSLQILSLHANSENAAQSLTGYTFPFDRVQFGIITAFAFNVAPPRDSILESRFFLATSTGAIKLYQGAAMLWTREEGLSAVNLPPLSLSGSVKPVIDSLIAEKVFINVNLFSRIRDQFLMVMSALRSDNSIPPCKRVPSDQNRIIFASSTFMTLYALDSRNLSTVIWRMSVPLSDQAKFSRFLSIAIFNSDVLTAYALTTTGVVRYLINSTDGVFMESGESHLLTLSSQPLTILFTLQEESNWDSKTRQLLCRNETFVARSPNMRYSTWKLILAQDEQIDSFISQDMDAVISSGRILGNRTTLVKYLNPHLIAIATLSDRSSSASIHLMDTTSGIVLYYFTIANITLEKNVQVYLRDNLLLYSYHDTRDPAASTRIVSNELYSLESTYSTISRTFLSSEGLSILGATKTHLGVTSYSSLFLSSSGQLVAVPRRAFDARRTYEKSTKQDLEELLFPYDPLLTIDSRWILSRKLKLLGINNAAAFPGRFESESIVLAYGLDIYSTRVSPSKSYDLLSPTFNRVQLFITFVSLSGAVLWGSSAIKSRKLRGEWNSG